MSERSLRTELNFVTLTVMKNKFPRAYASKTSVMEFILAKHLLNSGGIDNYEINNLPFIQ